MAADRITIRPVTVATWDDFARLFEARGSPHYCWCSPFRFRDAHEMNGAQKKAALHALVAGGTPVGLLAYVAGVPAGWCSVAPRETYVKLERSRAMPRVTPAPTWTVLCFFVARPHRGQGVSLALLRAAARQARAGGAEVIEGYPHDTAGNTATHRGHSSLFAAAGFRQEGPRWVRRVRPLRPGRRQSA